MKLFKGFTIHEQGGHSRCRFPVQSTLVISKSKGLSEILSDIRSSKYQISRIKEKINQTTTFHT